MKNLKKILTIATIFFSFITNAQESNDIVFLTCTGEEFTSTFFDKPVKGKNLNASPIFVEREVYFNEKTNKVIGGTRLLAMGCFYPEGVEKISCDCQITSLVITCNSKAFDNPMIIEDEFSINRRNGKMFTRSYNKNKSGQTQVTSWSQELQCTKINKNKF